MSIKDVRIKARKIRVSFGKKKFSDSANLIREDRKRKAQHQLESLLMAGLGTEVSEMTSADWDDIRRDRSRRPDCRDEVEGPSQVQDEVPGRQLEFL